MVWYGKITSTRVGFRVIDVGKKPQIKTEMKQRNRQFHWMIYNNKENKVKQNFENKVKQYQWNE